MPVSSRKKYSLASAIALALAAPLPAFAAADYLLQIEGIKGESQTKGYEGAIDLLSWGWGMSENAAGDACAQDFNLAKFLDMATPDLINAFDAGKTFSWAKLTGLSPSPEGALEANFRIELARVRVASINTGGSTGGDQVENLALQYEDAKGFYKPSGRDEVEFRFVPGKCK